MEKDLADKTAAWESAAKSFDALIAAKGKQINALTKEVEDKTARVGNGGVMMSQMEEDLEDTAESLEEDGISRRNLPRVARPNRQNGMSDAKTRIEELLALAGAVKILNEGDALELSQDSASPSSHPGVQVSSKVMAANA